MQRCLPITFERNWEANDGIIRGKNQAVHWNRKTDTSCPHSETFESTTRHDSVWNFFDFCLLHDDAMGTGVIRICPWFDGIRA